MLKLDFSLFEQAPPLGLVRTWDGVCLNSVWCTRYLVAPFDLLFEQTPHGRILKNAIFIPKIIKGNLTCIKDF